MYGNRTSLQNTLIAVKANHLKPGMITESGQRIGLVQVDNAAGTVVVSTTGDYTITQTVAIDQTFAIRD